VYVNCYQIDTHRQINHELHEDVDELTPKHFGALINKNIAQPVDMQYCASKRSLKKVLCSISFISLSLKLEYPFTVAMYLQFARNMQLKVLSTHHRQNL